MIYFIFEMIGTIAFAASGAMVAIEQKMDILGVAILGVTTAIGGGIIRDVLIGKTPPTSLNDPKYALVAVITALIVFIPYIRERLDMDHKGIVLLDAIGLGMFTVIGCNTAIPFNNMFLQVLLGVMTGVGGGVLRDMFATQKPMIFVKHFYAMASILGAILYSWLLNYNEQFAAYFSMAFIVVIRMFAAKYKWHLPKS